MTVPAIAEPLAAPALCRGQVIYADEAEALADARARRLTAGRKLGAYLCARCSGWHLERRRFLR